MTEPVTNAVSPRRTVRVAVALVAGQAVLCAVIGWVTFGSGPAAPKRVPPAAPIAAPPIVVPTASLALPLVTHLPTHSARPRHSSTRLRPRPPVRTTSATPRVTSARPVPVPTASAGPALAPSETPEATNPEFAAAGSPADDDEVQGPVVEGDPCDPAGARGVTADGVELRCVPDERDQLSWRTA